MTAQAPASAAVQCNAAIAIASFQFLLKIWAVAGFHVAARLL